MHQLPSIAIFQLGRPTGSPPPNQDPHDIHFEGNVLWIGMLENIIQQGSSFIGLELIPMRVIAKDQSMLFEGLADLVEIIGGFFCIFDESSTLPSVCGIQAHMT